jgi:TPP-dependent pyruvate/acetoin dehydrogenase alpha subunit
MTKNKNIPAPPGEGFSLIPNTRLLALYAAMAQARAVAEKSRAELPRQRVPKSSHFLDSILGHEAAVAGAAIDLKAHDTLVPTLWPDGALKAINSSVSVAPTLSAAIRSALAQKNNRQITLIFSSAKSSAQPAWHKALTVAAENRLPILFLSLNYSSSPPSSQAPFLKPEHLPVITVDGNDVVAVYRVATESMTYARKGRGPTLIDFSLSIPGDPLKNMEQYLALKGLRPTELLHRNSKNGVVAR